MIFRPSQVQPFGLTSSDRVLVPFAHPDDEILNACLLKCLVRCGVTTYTCTMTDGTQSTKGDQSFVRSGQRRGECQASFNQIGVDEKHQVYLGLPDGHLHEPVFQDSIVLQLADLVRREQITAIVTPGSNGIDGHSDHQTVHTCSVRAAQQMAHEGYKLSVWATNCQHVGKVVVPVNRKFKKRLAGVHVSQFGSNPSDMGDLKRYSTLVSSYESYDKIDILS